MDCRWKSDKWSVPTDIWFLLIHLSVSADGFDSSWWFLLMVLADFFMVPASLLLRLFPGKLRSRWYGPYTVTEVFPYGTIEVIDDQEQRFKVNGHRAKIYYGDDVQRLSVDLYFTPT
ncbi:hypothetical protein CTI12_AA503440 [Artemisia annua]|uniref:Uncharacterized protein n=1 Tax=Artemisia annua TaxID=35608 RepID=A0A2U1LD29_ARTAN|nr:hypothetical protein CTI12_AA503440 [Artemisia annua]